MSLTINIISKYPNYIYNNITKKSVLPSIQNIHQSCYLLNIVNLLYIGGNLPYKPVSKLLEVGTNNILKKGGDK